MRKSTLFPLLSGLVIGLVAGIILSQFIELPPSRAYLDAGSKQKSAIQEQNSCIDFCNEQAKHCEEQGTEPGHCEFERVGCVNNCFRVVR